ncbi:amylo-alpha-1,6-glucosidase [Bordetella sp. LUAb4]|uniref:amylo-alpha-1,6-glucosidase n=1 Tax=Bordetella sp. LUAb4 TaxID=2843195 RepID=UPI001E2BCA71|nr:amylo-alpha-1,6-glucosidase [Bordetella sp. LUAb4]
MMDGVGQRDNEWLEPDGRGGFASGTVLGPRTRRYHALLLCATRPPAGRVVLVNGVEVWLEGNGRRVPLTSQRYLPDLELPAATAPCTGFSTQPWPTWRLHVDDEHDLLAECLVERPGGRTLLRWRLIAAGVDDAGGGVADAVGEGAGAASSAPSRLAGDGAGQIPGVTVARADGAPWRLCVRPLLSGRDYHALHHENPAFDFTASCEPGRVRWRPYVQLPAVEVCSNGVYRHEPDWYRNFSYAQERERGLDDGEDLATPGVFTFDLSTGPAVMLLAAVAETAAAAAAAAVAVEAQAAAIIAAEASRRAAFPNRLHRSADAYLVKRDKGLTLLAGYPWFTDWGRDTFIAMRGLLLATGRAAEAGDLLEAWTAYVSAGMLPNRFPDDGGAPEYNTVDASLWFIVAVHDYLATGHAGPERRRRLCEAVDAILSGHLQGTRYGIAVDHDGLLRAGEPGQQLTWMDARVDGHEVTPRIGKPVEVQALWINALRIASAWDASLTPRLQRAQRSFEARFPSPGGGLFDVIDADHVAGRVDASIRPNQIFAVGGLPYPVLEGMAARHVLETVQLHLWTPLGLRTLAPSDPRYVGHYAGASVHRDAAYHQGTAWPWLMGPFVQAWLRVHGDAAGVRDDARRRSLASLLLQLDDGGLDHIAEVVDGDAPHAWGGAPCQAWSLGETLRIASWLDAAAPAGSGIVADATPSLGFRKPGAVQ